MIGIPFWIKAIGYGFLILIGVSMGWGLSDTVKVKPALAEVKAQKAEVGKLSAQLEGVISLNQDNDKVMLEANNRYNRMAASYEKRLKDAAKKCEDMSVICNLPPSTSTGGVPNASSNINNSLLLRINSLYP